MEDGRSRLQMVVFIVRFDYNTSGPTWSRLYSLPSSLLVEKGPLSSTYDRNSRCMCHLYLNDAATLSDEYANWCSVIFSEMQCFLMVVVGWWRIWNWDWVNHISSWESCEWNKDGLETTPDRPPVLGTVNNMLWWEVEKLRSEADISSKPELPCQHPGEGWLW